MQPLQFRTSICNLLTATLILFSVEVSASELRIEKILKSGHWQPLASMFKPDIGEQCLRCKGSYIDDRANIERAQSPTDSNLTANADQSDASEGRVTLSGNVSVVQGYRVIGANRVEIDRIEQTVIAEGNISIREPGVALYGDSASYNSLNEEATIHSATFLLFADSLAGSAQALDRDRNGLLSITDGAITYCRPDDPAWYIAAEKIKIDPLSGMGEAWGAKIMTGETSAVFLPWIQFPIGDERKSGLLFPDLGNDNRGGLDVTLPYYINIAPHLDATYSPRMIQKRGVLHQIKGRWLDKYEGLWEITGASLSGDKFSQEARKSRWLMALKQSTRPNDFLRTKVDYTRASDKEYLRELENNTVSAQRETALMQLGSVDLLTDQWVLSVEAQQFQSMAEDIIDNYRKSPQITAYWRGNQSWAGLKPRLKIQATEFDSRVESITGRRYFSELGIDYPRYFQAGYLRASLYQRSLNYLLKGPIDSSDNSPSLRSLVSALEGGLFFERDLTSSHGGVLQTLEPRFAYLRSDYADHQGIPDFDSAELTFNYQQLFRHTRFSGHDRLTDANQVAIGLTTRLIDTRTGKERLSASVGQIFYFKDQRVRLNNADPTLVDEGSALAFQMSAQIGNQWSLRSNWLYDSYDRNFEAANLRVKYRASSGGIFNASYSLREPLAPSVSRPVTEQIGFSFHLPINENWRVFSAIEHSLELNSNVEDMIGVEYDSCCWRFRLLYMNYIDPVKELDLQLDTPRLDRNNALQIQFLLKGMGGFGSRVDNLMHDMIEGFKGS